MNPFRKPAEKLIAEARARPKPPVKNRCRTKYETLRVTAGRKLGDAYLSHDIDGRPLAEIESNNAKLVELSGRDFTVDKAEPRRLHFMTFRQLERAYAAMMFLHCKGLGMDLFYTFTLRSVHLTTDHEVAEAIERHIEHLRHWLSDRGAEFHYIWGVERGRKRGLHMHLLMHLPTNIRLDEFKREVSQSIFTLTGMRPRRPVAERSKLANPSVPADDTVTVDFKRNRTVDQQWERLKYIFEGIDPREGVHVRGRPRREVVPIDRYLALRHFSYQGRYDGHRLGISRTLGREERNKFAAVYGMPPNALMLAKEPGDLYGTQYLDWSMTNKREVRLLRSLEI